MAKRFRLAYTAAALIPLSVLAAACSSATSPSSSSSSPAAAKMVGAALPTSPAKTPEVITETGSTLLYPLMGTWTNAYQKQYPVSSTSSAPIVTIETGSTGSGTGLSEAAAGTVNIGASDAYLSSSDLATTPTLMNIPLAISAQQVNYNLPSVKKPLKLDGTVLAEMYSGKITKWNDPAIAALNPGVSLPAIPVVPLHRADGSGDTFLFTSYLNAQDPSAWPTSDVGTTVSWPSVSGAQAEEGNGGMVTGCGAIKGCIAYIGVSYLAKTQAAGLGQAELKNGAGNYEAPRPRSDLGRGKRPDQQDAGQRDTVDDQRQRAERLPDRQLRVRHREQEADQRDRRRGHPRVPVLDCAHRPERHDLPGRG